MGKRVFVLGAGASCAANLPPQKNLLRDIFSLNKEFRKNIESDFMDKKVLSKGKTYTDQFFDDLLSVFDDFDRCRFEIARFIVYCFLSGGLKKELDIYIRNIINTRNNQESDEPELAEDDAENIISKCKALVYKQLRSLNVTLEDIFTLFDSVITGQEQFHDYTKNDIEDIRYDLIYCISYLLAYQEHEKCSECKVYDRFSKYLIDKRMTSSLSEDNLSIITLNWDDLLDRSLYRECKKLEVDGKPVVLPDYCMYDYPAVPNDSFIPSTHIKAKGIYNIKLLKLHGSLNWLRCPRCKRLFIDDKEPIAIKHLNCPCCAEIVENSPSLKGLIITPTFMKALNEMHLENIWHNAFIELSEASEVVFIGYSFPVADFEMRCLLKKAIRPGTKLRVVLSEYDSDKAFYDKLVDNGINSNIINDILYKIDFSSNRYKSFFGEGNVSVTFEGFEKYIEEIEHEEK